MWETSSTKFLNESNINNILSEKGNFAIYVLDEINDVNKYDKENKGHNRFVLQAEDLLCGNGNVEFYIGNNKYVGRCTLQKKYYSIKNYSQNNKDGYFYNLDLDGKSIAYKTIIRVKGDGDEKQE